VSRTPVYGIKQDSPPSSGQSAFSEATMTSARPVCTKLVVKLLAESALQKEDPVSELRALQRDRRFQYPAGQQSIFSAVLKAGREGLAQLDETGKFSELFLGLIRHNGELFQKFIVSQDVRGGSSSAAGRVGLHNDLSNDLCASWMNLAVDELTLFSRLPRQDRDHLEMAQHACEILMSLEGVWSQANLDQTMVQPAEAAKEAIKELLSSPAISEIFVHDRSLEGASLLRSAIRLAGTFRDAVLLEELVDLLPDSFAVLKEICPEEFSRCLEDDYQVSDEDSFDEYKSSPAPDINGSMTPKRATIIDDGSPEEVAELEAQISEANLHDAIIETWVQIFSLSLNASTSLMEQSHRAPLLVEILRDCPSKSPLWIETLDTLIVASEQGYRDFLPELVERACKDTLGGLIVLYIAAFNDRTHHPGTPDPLIPLVYKLSRVPNGQRKALLREIKELNNEGFAELIDAKTAKLALSRLHAELKKVPKDR
jgi:hypothetical protein